MNIAPTVLKLGGELLEDAVRLDAVAHVIARAAAHLPLIVVHGGGKEIDAALVAAGIQKRQVDGVRVTDAATLAVVVPVLAGTINTRLVAAVAAHGGQAVGLTGADATVAPAEPMAPLVTVDGLTVSLGLVGQPLTNGQASLLTHLVSGGYIPVIASISADRSGTLFNVNADTMAAAVAVRAGAARLVIAGTTPGVLDSAGNHVPEVNAAAEARMVAAGTVNTGMVAKLTACRQALAGGVTAVVIADGRDRDQLLATVLTRDTHPAGATVVAR